MFAALFSRSQEPPAFLAAKAERAAFDRRTEDDPAEPDHSLPVPWDWLNENSAAS